jgi:hypothetical protein
MGKTAVKSGSEVGKLLKDARSLIKGFRTSRRKTGNHLKRDLVRNRTQVRSDVKQMLSEFRSARKGTAAPEARGNGGGNGGKAAGQAGAELAAKVLGAVNNHPGGATMAGIAAGLGVAPVVIGKTLSSLVAGGRIRKEGRDYFPAAAS